MRRIFTALALAGTLGLPQAALAQSRTTLGVGSGAVAGALVAGPIGAVAGAVIGGVVGSSSERGRRYARRRRYGMARPVRQRRAEAELPRPAAEPARTPAPAAGRPATTWKDPR